MGIIKRAIFGNKNDAPQTNTDDKVHHNGGYHMEGDKLIVDEGVTIISNKP